MIYKPMPYLNYLIAATILIILLFAAFYVWLRIQERNMINQEREQRGRDRWMEFFNED